MAKTQLLSRRPKKQFQAGNIEIAKLVQQADKFGNKGIKDQQFSHRHIYHYLPLNGTTTINFFENVKNATSLLSNINENKLQVGEVMIIKEFFFDIITVSEPALVPTAITTETDFQTAGLSGFYGSQFEWQNDNNRVIKPIGLQEMNPKFNKNAFNASMNVITLKANITMMPLVTFTGTLKLPTYAAISNTFIGCHVVGIGTILAPKATY